MRIAAPLRELVRRRAGERCEYCRISQSADPFFTFHVEHVIARQHGGATDESNLALSCHHCNLHKGPNLTAIDPEDGTVVAAVFHPRSERWDDHFAVEEGVVRGKTPIGRATVRLLAMNDARRVRLRAASLSA